MKLARIEPGVYRTDDGLYEIKRYTHSRFRGGDRWTTDRGWAVYVAGRAPSTTPNLLEHEGYGTKAEAVAALEQVLA